MLTTYCLFPTAAGNMETCTERTESPPCCLMLDLHDSVRSFLTPDSGAPHCGWAQTFKEKKQVARNPAKTGKAKQTASRGRQWTLNPTECKANSAEGKGSPATLSGCQSSQDSSSLWRARAGRDGGEPLFPPQFTPLAGGEPPAAAPGTSLRTPPWTQLGLMTSIFPGSKGFVVETLPKEPNFGFSSQTFVERLQSIC